MQLQSTDFKFSGLSTIPFERAVPRLLGIEKIDELRLVAADGTRTIMSTGEHPLHLDYSLISRVELLVKLESVPTVVHIWLMPESESSARSTIVDGLLYVGHFVSRASRPAQALEALASSVVQIASCLDVTFLVVADEDDASLQVQPGDLLLPSLFGVYQKDLLDGAIETLTSNGAIVQQTPDPRYVLFWVAPPHVLVEGTPPTQGVLELLRHQLLTNPLPWSLSCRRFL